MVVKLEGEEEGERVGVVGGWRADHRHRRRWVARQWWRRAQFQVRERDCELESEIEREGVGI